MAFFATSSGLTNEVYYVFQKLARVLGTNNVDLCSRLCHAASVSGLKSTLGYGAPTCSLSDFIGTDLLVIFGSDLANNQPVTTKYMHYAKKAGTRIVVVNPMREYGLGALLACVGGEQRAVRHQTHGRIFSGPGRRRHRVYQRCAQNF